MRKFDDADETLWFADKKVSLRRVGFADGRAAAA